MFNLIYGKYRFDGDFFVRNLDASMERSARSGFFPEKMVSFLSSSELFFFFFFFFAHGLLANFDFLFLSMRNDFPLAENFHV